MRPRRVSPARRGRRRHTPRRAMLSDPRLDVAADLRTRRCGAIARICAWRRGELVPTTAPSGSEASGLPSRRTQASRGSARSRNATSSNCSGMIDGTSLRLWTARSTSPRSSASSSSLTKSPFAADGRERDVLPPVAGGLDDDDLAHDADGGEPARELVRLPERELAPAGSDSDGCHRRPKIFRMVSRIASPDSGFGSAADSFRRRIG